MRQNPTKLEKRINQFINSWTVMAPEKTFAEMTLEQFKTAVQPSLDARETIRQLEHKTLESIGTREEADKASMIVLERVVNGVRAHPTEGADSALYAAIGYVRKSARRTGLHRTMPVLKAA